jgi:hypothetical protein
LQNNTQSTKFKINISIIIPNFKNIEEIKADSILFFCEDTFESQIGIAFIKNYYKLNNIPNKLLCETANISQDIKNNFQKFDQLILDEENCLKHLVDII